MDGWMIRTEKNEIVVPTILKEGPERELLLSSLSTQVCVSGLCALPLPPK